MSRQFDYEKFENWENETHIPEDVMAMVNIVCNELGIPIAEETLEYKNRGGYTYAYCKGFILSHCTSSLANGPDYIDDFYIHSDDDDEDYDEYEDELDYYGNFWDEY